MITIDIRKEGDVRYRCPTCNRSVTLSAEGAGLYERMALAAGNDRPKCAKCHVELEKSAV